MSVFENHVHHESQPVPPAFRRGFLLDSARCQESRAYYRAFIDFAAERGVDTLLWHFTDDQGCSLQFDSVPGMASPHAYSKAEMRELVRYGADRGVELVPELASLGHSRYLTRLPQFRHLNEVDGAHFTGMCPVSDDTRRIIRTLIEEAADVFAGPNFHVGLDEVNIGGHPLTRAALRTATRGQLLADYAAFLHGVVTATGKRMWMWGDGLLNHAEMLAGVPKDVVICNWQYAPEPPPQHTHTLLDAGFDVMLCSALISHDQPLFPGEQFSLPNVRAMQVQRTLTGKGKVLGHLGTVWTPVRYIADSQWLGIDVAAGILAGDESDRRIERFGASFYGLPGRAAARFAEAARIVFEHSPLREPWLAAAKLGSAAPANEAFAAAQQQLARIAPLVTDHTVEFQAFSLMVDVLAHVHEAAASEATVELIDRGEALLAAVEADWDRSRYADDPRKYTAPVPSFGDDHLVRVLAIGLDRLRATVAVVPEVAAV